MRGLLIQEGEVKQLSRIGQNGRTEVPTAYAVAVASRKPVSEGTL